VSSKRRTYLIRTFWIGLVASLNAMAAGFVVNGILLIPLIAIWIGVRSVLSLIDQAHSIGVNR